MMWEAWGAGAVRCEGGRGLFLYPASLGASPLPAAAPLARAGSAAYTL